MTKVQLETIVASSIMQRPELIVPGNPTTFGVIDAAFTICHQDMQVRADFRCMEASTPYASPLVYTKTSYEGIPLPKDFKKGRYLWIINPTTGAKIGPIMADTEGGANLQRQHRMPTHYGSGKIDLQEEWCPSDWLSQRWFEKDGMLKLMFPHDANLILDYYSFLPCPVVDTDNNYFTNSLFKMLIDGTAAFAFGMLGDTDRESVYMQKYETDIATYQASDSVSKQAGTSNVYRPPLPRERMR